MLLFIAFFGMAMAMVRDYEARTRFLTMKRMELVINEQTLLFESLNDGTIIHRV